MKKTMFKRIFAGIAAVFTLGLCVPTGFTNIITQPSFEAVAEVKERAEVKARIVHEGDGWTLDADGLLTVSNGAVIGNYQFVCNNEIKKVTIGDNCTIGRSAFYGCAALTSVTIGNGCNIGERAFLKCTSLTNVTIGERCTIGSWAFYDCNSIQKVICKGNKNTVTVDVHNSEIICNKEKWITPSKCPKCSGWVIDFKCESCGYFDEAAAQAESARLKAEAERIDQLIAQNTTEPPTTTPTTTEEGNTASTFSDGSILVIVGGSTFLILCGLAAVIIVKRRKKTQ